MTPREVEQMSDLEYEAFVGFMRDEARAIQREQNRRRR